MSRLNIGSPLLVSVGPRWLEMEPAAQFVRTAWGRPTGLSSRRYASVRPHQDPRVRISVRVAPLEPPQDDRDRLAEATASRARG